MIKYFYLLIFTLIISCSLSAQNKFKYGLVIHGGAGSITKGSLTAAEENSYHEALKEALLAGMEILNNNGSSLNAVEAAVKFLEDSPLFNAGKGAVFNSKGQIELDASIMDGKTLMAGAVAGVHRIKNPISLARLVMEKSPHVLLIGDGAEEFAKEQGVEIVPADYFKTDKRWKQFQGIKEKEKKDSGELFQIKENQNKFGTVGAVALDKSGNLAAATSTGGMMMKKYGRVGDSPIIGAGTYANNNTCAVSATGHGEYFIRNVVCYDVSARMEYNRVTVSEAADFVINKKLKDTGGEGGVIAVDKAGNFTMPFNTDGMFRGYIDESGNWKVKFYSD